MRVFLLSQIMVETKRPSWTPPGVVFPIGLSLSSTSTSSTTSSSSSSVCVCVCVCVWTMCLVSFGQTERRREPSNKSGAPSEYERVGHDTCPHPRVDDGTLNPRHNMDGDRGVAETLNPKP